MDMAYKIFAAIDVGSTDVSMKIFEITARKGYRQIDYVSNIIELGSDTYAMGYISQDSLEKLCEILERFSRKMKEYGITEYCAYATSALREAKNNIMVLDLIKHKTGIGVRVLSNSEQRFLMYKGLAVKTNHFEKMIEKNTAIVDIGAGSIQVSLMSNQKLIATQNIAIGALRIRDRLKSFRFDRLHLEEVMEELIGSEIDTFRHYYLGDREIKNIVAIGEEIVNVLRLVPEFENIDHLNRNQLQIIFEKLLSKSARDIAIEYQIPYERATLLLPAIIICCVFIQQPQVDLVWIPKIDLNDGIIVDYLEKTKSITFKRNFEDDIRSSVAQIAKRYRCNKEHNTRVSKLACQIYDKTKKIHGLKERERLQLEIAATLYDCGKFINMSHSSDNSYAIVMSTEITGLSHKEREEIANIIKFTLSKIPDYHDMYDKIGDGEYMIILRLLAILKLAYAMNQSSRQKLDHYTIQVKNKQLVITMDTLYDLTLERRAFEANADFFQQVYGIRPVLKQKRSI